jgi:hypothetical protein
MMVGARVLILALLVLTLSPGAAFAGGGLVKGKVNYQGKPLGGAVVYLYSDYKGGFKGKPDFQAGPTGADGVFEAAVPGGRYYLIARKSLGGGDELKPGDFYSYYGGNPVVVGGGETINIGVNCSPIIDAGERYKSGGVGIRGKVYADGKPLERARVTLYQDGDTIFRGIGYASVLTSKDGDFSFNLEPGTYYVVTRKRAGEDRMGPLGEGDSFGFAADNPVEVKEGTFTVISINAVTKLISKVKAGGQEVTLGGTVKAGETVIEGVVKGKDGAPVPGVYASAYRDSMMTQKPDFISKVTGPDGTYSISLSEGGEYFVGARDTIGGPAEKGDLLGRYAGSEDHSVAIKTGEKLKGIDVTVEPVE